MAVHHGSQPEEEAVVKTPKQKESDSLLQQANRFEKIIKLIKGFQLSTRSYSAEPFEALRMDVADFTLVLDVLTSTSYVLVIASNSEPRIST
jgi:hypothetical protein